MNQSYDMIYGAAIPVIYSQMYITSPINHKLE